MKRRSFAALLLALVTLLSLAACGETAPTETTTEAQAATSAAAETTAEETKLEPDLPDVKYNCDFTIASGYVTETKYTSNLIACDEINGDSINDAVYNRTVNLESRFGIKIVVEDIGYAKINTDYKAGNRSYDIGTATLSEIMTVVNQGTTVDLNTVSTASLDNPWWDQNANSKFRIGDKLFYTLSDFFITGMDNCRCIYFNKTLAEELNLGKLYSLVDSNEWTIDKMAEMSKKALSDLNGDGTYNENDRLGIANNATTFYEVMLTGCDAEIIKQDDNGIPYICPLDDNEFFVSVYTKLLDLFSKDNTYYICSMDTSRNMFSAGNCLFVTDTMYLCSVMRQNSDVDFGIMPVPKYNADQEKYLQVSPNPDVFFIINGSEEDIDRAGVILEAASYYSSAYYSDSALMPSYFELALKGKSAKDNDSASNLQLVHDNLSYVIKIIGTDFSNAIYTQFKSANYNISSTITQYKKVQTKALEKVFETYGVTK